jgi:hypothetical protein
MDHADAVLEDLQRERGQRQPDAADWRDTTPLKPVALARRHEVTRAVNRVQLPSPPSQGEGGARPGAGVTRRCRAQRDPKHGCPGQAASVTVPRRM